MIAKKKLNGQIISELTGFTGKELGAFIKHIKTVIQDWDQHIINLPTDALRSWVIKESDTFKVLN